MTYKEYLALSCEQALAGTNSIVSPILDIEIIAETLVPEVFQSVALSYAADPQKASLLARDHTITLTNGVGDVPEEVLTQCKFNATATDDDDSTVRASLVRTWNDFIMPSVTDRLIARWTIKDDTIYWLEVGAEFDPTDGKTGDITLNIPSTPVIPATEGTALAVQDEVISDLISSLAQRLRGKLELAA